jgi:hypothetical protein
MSGDVFGEEPAFWETSLMEEKHCSQIEDNVWY